MAKYINLDDPDVTYSHNAGNHEVYIVGSEAERIDIVRCGECVNWDRTWNNDNWPADFERHYCPMVDLVTSAVWYCFDGERRADDE